MAQVGVVMVSSLGHLGSWNHHLGMAGERISAVINRGPEED